MLKQIKRRVSENFHTNPTEGSFLKPQQSENNQFKEVQMIIREHQLRKSSMSNQNNDLTINNSEEIERQEETDIIDYDSGLPRKHSKLSSKSSTMSVADKNKIPVNPIESDYDIWDLTYTMITSNIPVVLIVSLFIALVIIRYYTIAMLINIAIQSHAKHLVWIIVVIGDRVIYFILVVKISLKSAQTKTQITLKSHWNSKQSQINELFSIIDQEKLCKSIIRGIIPAQLAFLYINAAPLKRFQLYAAINYIYASIQAVVYYPFFVIYTSIVVGDKQFDLTQFINAFTLSMTVVAELIMLNLSIFLLLNGIKRKYGRILYCC